MSFAQSIEKKVKKGRNGEELVGKVVEEWETIVNLVIEMEVGEKVVVGDGMMKLRRR